MNRTPSRRRRRWLWLGLAVVLAVALELAIRAGEPRTVGPSGVDTLEVPWVEPAADAFVGEVDHPWLPLEPGTTWRFTPAVAPGAPEGTEVEVRVLPRTRPVAGIDATVVVLDEVERYVAQDVDGNVWLLGEHGHGAGSRTPDWSIAGGSPAGLVLPAVPRRGDGWATVVPDGEVHGVTRTEGQVVSADGDRLLLTVTTEAVASETGRRRVSEVRLARGRGVVEVVAPDGRPFTRSD